MPSRLDTHLYKEITIGKDSVEEPPIEQLPVEEEPPIEEVPGQDVPVEVNTLTIDGPCSVGNRHVIRSNGTSENGVLYQFWIKDLSKNKWTMIQDYSKSSAAWTPTEPGEYLYGVHIKDEKSNERLDAHLYKEITIDALSIVIDPGHGGRDPGAIGNGKQEKVITLQIAKKLKTQLTNLGYNVIMTRSSDEFLELYERSALANKTDADIFFSIHANSFPTSAPYGIETFHYPGSTKGKDLATFIQNEVIKATGANNRGVKSANFHVVRETIMPSALIEVGFISNPQECTMIANGTYQNKIVSGMVKGIQLYFEKH